jgi:prevent-host-death family protein
MDIAVSDAGRRLPELLDRVEQGEAVTITREGRPVATLKAVKPAPVTDIDRRRIPDGRLADRSRSVR